MPDKGFIKKKNHLYKVFCVCFNFISLGGGWGVGMEWNGVATSGSSLASDFLCLGFP